MSETPPFSATISLSRSDASPGRAIRLAASPEDPSIADDFRCNLFGSYHATGICHFVFGDGSVHKIHPSINTTLLGRLANRRDGQPIPDTWQR